MRQWWVRLVLVALAYIVAGRLALLLAISPGFATAIWPASAIGVIAVVRWGWSAAIGVGVGILVFGPRKQIPTTQPASRSPFTLAGRNDLYGDALNEAVFMRPGQGLTDGLVRLEDKGIDGAVVGGTATAITDLSSRARRIQNGFVRSYAATMVVGAAVLGVVLVLGRLG